MIGQVLGHYRVLEKIGAGGMGEVYRASDDRLGREVAIKVLKSSLANDKDRLRRFELEARAAAALNHPNIVAIFDIGLHGGAPYIVSELLEGQTLRQKLINGAFPFRQITDYSSQIARGLVAAHEKGIVHRDLKPENLFVTHDGRVKILDFGIAKLTSIDRKEKSDKNEELPAANMTTQTKSGSVLGTVAYMSPEQLRAKPVDHRSDIFSFGAILYEMLTGRRAFSGETEADTMMAVLREDPRQMTLVRQSVPIAFERIVQHCLEKEPDERFQSARELVFALSTVSDLSTSKPVSVFRGNALRWRKSLPWVGVLLALGAAGFFLGERVKSAPVYRRLTFERGTIYSARFTPDGGSVAYGASWNGQPLELYSTLADAPLAHPLGITSTNLLGLSGSNELAVSLHGMHGGHLEFVNGTLATEPIAGGAPREVLEDVLWADWSPDGKLAVVHHVPGRRIRLEYPIGTVLYETTGTISHIRVSPHGDRIAYMDHPEASDDRGSVCVTDLAGHHTTLSSGWDSEDGLAWSPKGDEIWFTAIESGHNRQLWAVNLSGRRRQVLGVPAGITLHDVASDGRVLFTVDSERLAMEWSGESKQVQDLSWYDWTEAKDISKDGQWVLFEESGEPAGLHYAVGIRKIDGSPPIRLGDGTAGGLSPDSKWAASVFTGTPEHLTLFPVGAGQPREVPLPRLEHMLNGAVRFLPDGQHIALDGNEPGRSTRTYITDLSGAQLRAVTPEGISALMPSPDGKYLVGARGKDGVVLFPVDGGQSRTVAGVDTSYVAAEWSSDSKALYIYRPGDVPVNIYRLDIATGKKELLRELVPADRAGVVSLGPVICTQSGSEFAYSYYQTLSVLYVVSGLN